MLSNPTALSAVMVLRQGWLAAAALVAGSYGAAMAPRRLGRFVFCLAAGVLGVAAGVGLVVGNLAGAPIAEETAGALALYAGTGGSMLALLWSRAANLEWAERWMWSLMGTAICAAALAGREWLWKPWFGYLAGTGVFALAYRGARRIRKGRSVALGAGILAGAVMLVAASQTAGLATFAAMVSGAVLGVVAYDLVVVVPDALVRHRFLRVRDRARTVDVDQLRPLLVVACSGLGIVTAVLAGATRTVDLLGALTLVIAACFGLEASG